MSDAARDNAHEEVCVGIVERLNARRDEIALAIYARIREAVPDLLTGDDPEYQAGVHSAISEILDYSFEGITQGPQWSGTMPPSAAAQARRAARLGVGLGAVLRRYLAGHGRLGEFITEVADNSGYSGHEPALRYLRRTQAALLERLTAAIEYEYNHERHRLAPAPELCRAQIIQRLLASEPVGPAEVARLNYELHASWHVGVIATGATALDAVLDLKPHLGRKLLPVTMGEETVWAWFGGQQKPTIGDIEYLPLANGATSVLLAIGEPGRGLDGWRVTHDQAQEALRIAARKPKKLARYADGPLLAAALQNDTLARWLKVFLSPLDGRGDGSKLRQTLRAYIDAECNATSAAPVLKISRHTVESHVRVAEELLGRPLRTCIAELNVALTLDELDRAIITDDTPFA
jgi:PucR C-terminal helix-turn-helix domain